MYTSTRNKIDPYIPTVLYAGENYWPVKIRHYSNGKTKWIYIHEDEPRVKSFLEETIASARARESKAENFQPCALIDEYEQNGDSQQAARIKAENALVPIYRKQLRKVLLEYLQWMHAMKKDSTFRKVLETKNELKETESYDWLESTETRHR